MLFLLLLFLPASVVASWVSKKDVSTTMTAIWQYSMRTVCIQICNIVAQGSSLRPETLWVLLRTWRNSHLFLFQCNQLNSWPRSLKVTSQLMRYSSVPFKHVLTWTSFYFLAITEIFPPFLPWLCQPWPHHDYSLSPNYFILISSPRSSQLRQPSENGKRMG